MHQAASMGNTAYVNNAQMMLAQIDMDERRWAAGRDKLREASRAFAASK